MRRLRQPRRFIRRVISGRRQPRRSRRSLERELHELHARLGWLPGHFYSPIPSPDEVRRRADQIFATPIELPGIDLEVPQQLELLSALRPYIVDGPFQDPPRPGLRYRLDNPNFGLAEAAILSAMLRYLRPRRIVEIGSGYSSAVILDTNDLALGSAVNCTFIDPFPDLLRSLLRAGDPETVDILPLPVQDVDIGLFASLEAGDVVFVDSSHVVKVGSDVNHIVFEVLPALAAGVHIHFHDVRYPFEYPYDWLEVGRAWNEAYLLRAFLQFNRAFRVVLYPSYLALHHTEAMAGEMPTFMRNPGSSLWIVRAACDSGSGLATPRELQCET
jgi:hypothetical protein